MTDQERVERLRAQLSEAAEDLRAADRLNVEGDRWRAAAEDAERVLRETAS